MSRIEKDLRKCVAESLKEGTVKYVIGYETGSLKGKTRPYLVRTPEEAAKLVWNNDCKLNLAKYVLGVGEKIGVIVKGCDGRALVELIKENQIKRENLLIIAPECSGVSTTPKLGEASSGAKSLAEHCRGCKVKVSPIYDIVLHGSSGARPSSFEKSSQEAPLPENQRSWSTIFSECIKCMACVKACPLCYCVDCSIEGYRPLLISKLRMPKELMTFHLIRALHMAGRCVECGACEFACPIGIPLTRFYSQVNKEVGKILGYSPGLSTEAKLPVRIVELEGVIR